MTQTNQGPPERGRISRRKLLAASLGAIAGALGGCSGLTALSNVDDVGLPFRFQEVTDELGIQYETMGAGISNTSAGVYINDFNDDGLEDVLLVGGEQPVLYQNTGERFVRSEALPAVDDHLNGDCRVHSALFLDYDNDGWEDLLLLPGGGEVLADYTEPVENGSEETSSGPILLHNDGGSFSVEKILNVDLARWPIGAATADYDGDGYLDVFIYQNGNWADRRPTGYHDSDTIGRIERTDVLEDNGSRNILLKGDGETFEDVSEDAGISGERWSLAASFVDLTGDGRPDVHVANDYNEDTLYLNRGDGTFEQRFMGPESDRNGMSSEVQDLTGDGLLDIYVTNIQVDRDQLDLEGKRGRVFIKQQAAADERDFGGNNLFVNQGDGEFVDKAEEFNAKDAPFVWGWDALMIDLDNDGDLDIIHANNQVDTITSTGANQMVVRSEGTPPGLWANRGDEQFEALNADEVGFEMVNERGLASLDVTASGRRDLLFVEDEGPARLYENRTSNNNNWFQALIQGDGTHTPVGARATLTAGDLTQLMVNDCKSDYQSQNSRVLHWGLGHRSIIDELEVEWPDGTERTFEEVEANRRVRIAPTGDLEVVRS